MIESYLKLISNNFSAWLRSTSSSSAPLQCHVFRCLLPGAVNKIFVSFVKAFHRRSTRRSTSCSRSAWRSGRTMGRVTSCTCHSESKLTERETEVLQFMLWSPKMDILATRPGGADLLCSGLWGRADHQTHQDRRLRRPLLHPARQRGGHRQLARDKRPTSMTQSSPSQV